MAISVIENSYNGLGKSTYASQKKEVTKKAETKETLATQKKSDAADNNSDYLNKLQKMVPGITLETGGGLVLKNDGKINTLTINPKILKEMQSDPEKEKYYQQRLKDFESATKWVDGVVKSLGFTTIYRHGYMDENGNFSSISHNVRKDKLNEKLRKEAQENAEERIEKSREKAAENKKEQKESAIEELLKPDKAEEFIKDKLEKSKDGKLYLYQSDIQTIIEATKNKQNNLKSSNHHMDTKGINLDKKI